MSPELPPFIATPRARARIRAAAPRSRRVASPRIARRRAAAVAKALTSGGALTALALGLFLLAWYGVSRDQQQQQIYRQQVSRINAIAPGP
jgi:alkylation response protein AidB-like acyl-CoA dehydrogenase